MFHLVISGLVAFKRKSDTNVCFFKSGRRDYGISHYLCTWFRKDDELWHFRKIRWCFSASSIWNYVIIILLLMNCVTICIFKKRCLSRNWRVQDSSIVKRITSFGNRWKEMTSIWKVDLSPHAVAAMKSEEKDDLLFWKSKLLFARLPIEDCWLWFWCSCPEVLLYSVRFIRIFAIIVIKIKKIWKQDSACNRS